MALIGAKEREQVEAIFSERLLHPVRLLMFTQAHECEFCTQTRELIEDIAALSELVHSEIHDFVVDRSIADQYGIDKIPAVAVLAEKDYGVRIFGIPSGYEFTTLVEAIVNVSRGESGLSEASVTALAGIADPVHLQVFVTPTCPYCPGAVSLAHRLAIQSEYIRTDMVESVEFPHLAIKYDVFGVPRTVINETVHVEGLVGEGVLVQSVLDALSADGEE